MSDQLTDRARKAADEIGKKLCSSMFDSCEECRNSVDWNKTRIICLRPWNFSQIIERHMREASKENLKEFLDFMLKTWNEVHKNDGIRFMNKKEAVPCPEK